MIKLVIIIAAALFVASSSVCKPEFLANNKFIDEIASHELLALLSVIMTITFASVANMHFIISRIISIQFARDISHGQRVATEARRELNSNAWLLFWTFIATIAFLVTKGTLQDNIHIKSAMNGLCMGSLLVNILVFYDIYETMFGLASSDVAAQSAGDSNISTEP